MSNTNVSPLTESVAIRQELEAAAQTKTAIRIFRDEIEDGWIDGVVAAIGSSFFAIELISNAIYLDGFVCLRIEDVSSAEFPAPHWSFQKAALSIRNQLPSEDPLIDCTNISALLRSVPEDAGLISIHIEKTDVEVCYIGKISELNDESLTLVTMSPDATWDDEQMVFQLPEITRVDFGGAYEDALTQVNNSTRQ